MAVSDLWGAVGRRWYVVLLGVLATAALTFGVSQVVPVTYETKALVVLLPPTTQKDLGGNPFLGLNGLDSLAAVLGRSMTSDALAAEVKAVSDKATFSVGPDSTTSGPVILATVEDPSSAGATKVLDRILAEVPIRLKALQIENGAPADTLVSQTLVSRDAEPKAQNKDLIRALIVVAGAGLAASIAAAALVDRLLSGRRASRLVGRVPHGSTPRQRPRPHPRPRPELRRHDELGQDTRGRPQEVGSPLARDDDAAPHAPADPAPAATTSVNGKRPRRPIPAPAAGPPGAEPAPPAPSSPDERHDHSDVEHAQSPR